MYNGDGACGDRVVDAALKKGAMSLIGAYIGMGGKGWASSSTRTGPRENSEHRGDGSGGVVTIRLTGVGGCWRGRRGRYGD